MSMTVVFKWCSYYIFLRYSKLTSLVNFSTEESGGEDEVEGRLHCKQ
jgi:hypothetical protein